MGAIARETAQAPCEEGTQGAAGEEISMNQTARALWSAAALVAGVFAVTNKSEVFGLVAIAWALLAVAFGLGQEKS